MNSFYQTKLTSSQAILAPMAGYTDAPFRLLCREFGSNWAVTEMVSAKGLVQGDLQGIEIGEPYPGEPDLVIQLFGGEPELVAAGARIVYERYQPSALDLNMGCPVKKVTGKSCGSKLMLDPERASNIIRAMRAAVPIPISAKLRLGYDSINIYEVAQALAEAGVQMLSIHGRTAKQRYSGEANWEIIAAVAEQVAVPVVGSGDVYSREQFLRYTRQGLGVMVGRAAVGRPWLFAELTGIPSPARAEKARIAYRHALLHLNWYTGTSHAVSSEARACENHAMRHFRAQLLKYFPELRSQLILIERLSELRMLLEKYYSVSLAESEMAALVRSPAPRNRKTRQRSRQSQTHALSVS